METGRDMVLRVATIESFKWQRLLNSEEITAARCLSSVHETDALVAEQAFLPIEAVHKLRTCSVEISLSR